MDTMDERRVGVNRDWEGIIEAQASSGQSAAGFCREHGIAYHLFLYHRRKIRRPNSQSLAMARSGGGIPATRGRGFIPLRVGRGSGIRLHLPGGLLLESDELPGAAWVVEVAGRWVMVKGKPC